MPLNILLSLTLFALVIQANCIIRSIGSEYLDDAVKEAANKVSKAIENNPNAYKPLTEKSLYIPDAGVLSGVGLQLSNGTVEGLSSLEGEKGNLIEFIENVMTVYLKFDNLSFAFDFVSEDIDYFLPSGSLQFIASDLEFDCSVKVESYSPFVLGEFLIPNDTRVGKMELLLDNLSYKDYIFYKQFDFEAVLKEYAQKMSDYARETLSEYSYYLVEQLQKQLSKFYNDLPLYI